MADMIIKGDEGYYNIPVKDIGAPPDYTLISGVAIETDWRGTLSDPVTIWKSGEAYIKCAYYVDTHGGQNYRLEVNPLSGWTPSTSTPFYIDYGNVTSVYIGGCLTGQNGIVFLSADGEFPTIDYLYYGSRHNLESQLVEDREWDESPSENEDDPDNLDPRGGAYADLGLWNENDLMKIEDMPDPEDFELEYGSLLTCYALHNAELARIASGLFSPNFWSALKQKFEGLSDPMTFILDCVELPLPMGGGIGRFKLGGVVVEDSNGQSIGCAVNSKRYRKYSMGSLTLKEVWGSAKDYTDCTISLFLPYVGVREVDPDVVLNSSVSLHLYVDMWNGDVVYLLHSTNYGAQSKYFRQDNVIYRWAGNCGKKIPLGRVDNSNQVLQAVSGIASIAGGYAMGGIAGAVAMGAPFAQNVLNGGFKPTVQTSGGISGNSGRMDYQFAYFIIKRGVPEYPNNWRAEIGAPRNQTFQLSDLRDTGYTLFSHIQLGNMGNATEEEKSELERLLTTEGIIL